MNVGTAEGAATLVEGMACLCVHAAAMGRHGPQSQTTNLDRNSWFAHFDTFVGVLLAYKHNPKHLYFTLRIKRFFMILFFEYANYKEFCRKARESNPVLLEAQIGKQRSSIDFQSYPKYARIDCLID